MKALWLIVPAFLLVVLAPAPSKADAGGAIVIHKDTGLCGMVGSDAGGNETFGGIGNIQLDVTNKNMVMLTCKGTNITNDSGKGQHFSGFPCGLFDGNGNTYLTTDTEATVSESGQASLTCRVRL